MATYLFDVKAFTTIEVDAPDEATARKYATEALEGYEWESSYTESAGGFRAVGGVLALDGEHDLMEIDGEAV